MPSVDMHIHVHVWGCSLRLQYLCFTCFGYHFTIGLLLSYIENLNFYAQSRKKAWNFILLIWINNSYMKLELYMSRLKKRCRKVVSLLSYLKFNVKLLEKWGYIVMGCQSVTLERIRYCSYTTKWNVIRLSKNLSHIVPLYTWYFTSW